MITLTRGHLIGAVVGLFLGVILARILYKKQRTDSDSFLSRVFTSGQDLDTTMGIIAFVWIVTIMVVYLQEALSDAKEVGYIILAATNGLSSIAGVKMGHSMRNGGKS